MKDSFILFTEYSEQFNMLSDEQAGVLIKAIFAYSSDSELPEMDAMTKLAFSFIRSALDRSDDKYQRKLEANRENGKLGGRPRKPQPEPVPVNSSEKPNEKPKQNPTETQKPNGFFQKPPERDNEHDNEPDSVCVNERGVKGENTPTPFECFIEKWGINTASLANYHGGKVAEIDWDKVSERIDKSTFLKKPKNLSFFIDHYEDIVDGKYDDFDDSGGAPRGRVSETGYSEFDTSHLDDDLTYE